MGELNNIFAENLDKVARAPGGVGVVALARLARIGKTTVYGIISGKDRDTTTLDTVEALAKAAKVPAWQMLVAGGPSSSGDVAKLNEIYSELSPEAKSKLISYAEDLATLDQVKTVKSPGDT